VIALLTRKQRNSEIAALYIALLQAIQKPPDGADQSKYLEEMARRTTQFVSWVETNPELTGDDWIAILRHFTNLEASIPLDVSQVIFSGSSSVFIGGLVEKALVARSLFSLIEELCNNDTILFEVIQHPLNFELNRLIKDLEAEETEHRRLTDELQDLEDQIERLETEDIEIKPFYCDRCGAKLRLPYIGFFCGHKVHSECCTEGTSCPLCPSADSPSYFVPPEEKRRLELPDASHPDLLEAIVTMIQNGYFSE
jgi:cell division protein FtsB